MADVRCSHRDLDGPDSDPTESNPMHPHDYICRLAALQAPRTRLVYSKTAQRSVPTVTEKPLRPEELLLAGFLATRSPNLATPVPMGMAHLSEHLFERTAAQPDKDGFSRLQRAAKALEVTGVLERFTRNPKTGDTRGKGAFTHWRLLPLDHVQPDQPHWEHATRAALAVARRPAEYGPAGATLARLALAADEQGRVLGFPAELAVVCGVSRATLLQHLYALKAKTGSGLAHDTDLDARGSRLLLALELPASARSKHFPDPSEDPEALLHGEIWHRDLVEGIIERLAELAGHELSAAQQHEIVRYAIELQRWLTSDPEWDGLEQTASLLAEALSAVLDRDDVLDDGDLTSRWWAVARGACRKLANKRRALRLEPDSAPVASAASAALPALAADSDDDAAFTGGWSDTEWYARSGFLVADDARVAVHAEVCAESAADQPALLVDTFATDDDWTSGRDDAEHADDDPAGDHGDNEAPAPHETIRTAPTDLHAALLAEIDADLKVWDERRLASTHVDEAVVEARIERHAAHLAAHGLVEDYTVGVVAVRRARSEHRSKMQDMLDVLAEEKREDDEAAQAAAASREAALELLLTA